MLQNSQFGTVELFPGYNDGSTLNQQGFEINLQTQIIKSKEFEFDFLVSLYKSNAVYTSLTNDYIYTYGDWDTNGSFINKLEKNNALGYIYGYQFTGVYLDGNATIAKDVNGNNMNDLDGNPIITNFNGNYNFEEGDARYADLDHNGTINDYDVSLIGNTNPLISGSFAPSFRYKNVGLGVYFNFRYGNEIANMARMYLENMTGYDNQSVATLNRWRAPGMETEMPRALYNEGYNWLGSSRFIEDGSFIRLKAITLKYEFSSKLIQKLYLNNLSCFVTCRNLKTWKRYKGADPDFIQIKRWDLIGYDYNYTAPIKEFTFGFNIGI